DQRDSGEEVSQSAVPWTVATGTSSGEDNVEDWSEIISRVQLPRWFFDTCHDCHTPLWLDRATHRWRPPSRPVEKPYIRRDKDFGGSRGRLRHHWTAEPLRIAIGRTETGDHRKPGGH